MDLAACTNEDLIRLIGAATGIGGMVGGFAGWLLHRRQTNRDITPIFTPRHGTTMEVSNRCAEPLFVTEIWAKSRICTSNWVLDGYGHPDQPIFESNRCYPNWEVPANTTLYFPFAVEDPSERSLRIRAHSSLGTIRSRFRIAR